MKFKYIALLLVCFAFYSFHSVAVAVSSLNNEDPQKLSSKCTKQLFKVERLITKKKWAKSEKVLKSALDQKCSLQHEQVDVWRWIGFIMHQQKRIAESTEAYQRAIDLMPRGNKDYFEVLHVLAQLRFVLKEFDASIAHLEEYMESTGIKRSSDLVLLARALYQKNQKNDALAVMEPVIEFALQENALKKAWLDFYWTLYYEMRKYPEAIAVSGLLIDHYPDDKVWRQLNALCRYAWRTAECGLLNEGQLELIQPPQSDALPYQLRVAINSATTDLPLPSIKSGEARALAEFSVSKEGRPYEVSVKEVYPASSGFEEAAIKAIENLYFYPRLLEGDPIVVEHVQYELQFIIKE